MSSPSIHIGSQPICLSSYWFSSLHHAPRTITHYPFPSSNRLCLIWLAGILLLPHISFPVIALSLGVLSLIGHQVLSHLLFIIKSKACWLMKSLVLDSTILRERHKSALESLYWSHCFVFHGNSSTARLKTLITTNSLITITIGRISQCTIATIRQVTVLHYFSYLLVKG